jgi:hypothetical protein
MMQKQARSLRHCARWILASCCTPAKFIFWSFKNSFLCFFLSALGMWAPSEFHFLFGKKLWAPSYPCFFSIVSILVGARGSAQVVGVLDGRTRRRSRRRQRSDTILVAGVLAWAAAPRKTGERDCHHVYWNSKEVTEIQLNRRDCAQSPVTLHDTRVLALYSNSCNWHTHTITTHTQIWNNLRLRTGCSLFSYCHSSSSHMCTQQYCRRVSELMGTA